MTIDNMIEVLQASKDGKKIEQRLLPELGGDCNGPLPWEMAWKWDFYRYEYRVKPEPREWMVQVGKNDPSYIFMPRKDGWGYFPEYETIKVREVLE